MAGDVSKIKTAGTKGLISKTKHGHGAGANGDGKEAGCVVAQKRHQQKLQQRQKRAL